MDLPSSVCNTPRERFESAEDVEEWIWSLEDCDMRDALLSFVRGEHLEGAEWLASFMHGGADGSGEKEEGWCGGSSPGSAQGGRGMELGFLCCRAASLLRVLLEFQELGAEDALRIVSG